MAVAIRLRREGNRNRAFYRIVVADKRARRDGRFIETLGTYDPLQEGTNFKVDVQRADDWIFKGAQPSETVRSILKKARREAANAPAEPAEEAAPAPELLKAEEKSAPAPAKAKEESAPAPEPVKAKEESAPAPEPAKAEEESAPTPEPEPAKAEDESAPAAAEPDSKG